MQDEHSYEALSCDFGKWIQGNFTFAKTFYVILFVLCSTSALIAMTGNSLFLLTMWRTSSLRSSSNLLLSSLAFADFCTGLVVQPLYVILLVMFIFGLPRSSGKLLVYMFFASPNLFIIGSFLTLIAISVERLLALRLHLRYRELVTEKKTLLVVATVWVTSLPYTLWLLLDVTLATYILVTAGPLLACVRLWRYFKIF